MDRIKYFLKSSLKSITFIGVLIEILIIFILYKVGFRITYGPELEASWDAISAIGQWAGVLVGFLIPIAAVYLQNSIDKNKKDIGESNIALLEEFEKFRIEYAEKLKIVLDLVDEQGNFIIDGGTFEDNNQENLKEKAHKFVNISMTTNTQRVAEHLGISIDDTFDILEELLRHDEVISAGGIIIRENIGNIIWTKKSKR